MEYKQLLVEYKVKLEHSQLLKGLALYPGLLQIWIYWIRIPARALLYNLYKVHEKYQKNQNHGMW